MDGRKTQAMACAFYLIDRETGETIQAGEVPPKALETMQVHLSQNLSDYYSRHMEQYIPLRL